MPEEKTRSADNSAQGGRVEERIRSARDTLPGRRDGLPKGSLGGLPPDPQGDEHREPPPVAPTYPP